MTPWGRCSRWRWMTFSGTPFACELDRVSVAELAWGEAASEVTAGRRSTALRRRTELRRLTPSAWTRTVRVLNDPDGNAWAVEQLPDLIEAWKVAPAIHRTYPLSEAAAAIRYMEQGHARGKLVISV